MWHGTEYRFSSVLAFIDLVIGVIWEAIAGYFGGTIDDVMMRSRYSVRNPYLLVVILLLVVMKPGLTSIIIAMSLTGWVGMARLVRGRSFSAERDGIRPAAGL